MAKKNTKKNALRRRSALRAALHGLSANKTGFNKQGHELDNHLAWVKTGDMVIPPYALTPAVVQKLKAAMGDQWQTLVIGQGREINIEELLADRNEEA